MTFSSDYSKKGENGGKKQNTLPYTLQFKVVEVCLVGAGDESLAFGGAPRPDIINVGLCLTSFSFSLPRKAKRSLSFAAPPSTLVSFRLFPKRKTPLRGTFVFLEQFLFYYPNFYTRQSTPLSCYLYS